MQLALYFDQTRCTGCYTCVVACKDWHDIPAGPANWIRVTTIERGKYPHPFLAFLASTCVVVQGKCQGLLFSDSVSGPPQRRHRHHHKGLQSQALTIHQHSALLAVVGRPRGA
jgi:hypothetical protein